METPIYPRWKHHPTEPSVLVKDAGQEAALGEDWGDTPHPRDGKAPDTSAIPEPKPGVSGDCKECAQKESRIKKMQADFGRDYEALAKAYQDLMKEHTDLRVREAARQMQTSAQPPQSSAPIEGQGQQANTDNPAPPAPAQEAPAAPSAPARAAKK